MQGYIDGRDHKDDPPTFQAPGDIVFMPVDPKTGALVAPATPGAIDGAFIAGTQPGGLSR